MLSKKKNNTANLIEYDLVQYLLRTNNNDICVPRFYYQSMYYECDVFSMTKSGYTTEYEVKTTKSDLLNDFKKGRKWCNENKHELILNGERTNKFYFVIPKEFTEDKKLMESIPKQYGIIYYTQYNDGKYGFWYHVTAKQLHKQKISEKDKLRAFYTLYGKYIHLFNLQYRFNSGEITKLERENKKLEEKKNEFEHELWYAKEEINKLKLRLFYSKLTANECIHTIYGEEPMRAIYDENNMSELSNIIADGIELNSDGKSCSKICKYLTKQENDEFYCVLFTEQLRYENYPIRCRECRKFFEIKK